MNEPTNHICEERLSLPEAVARAREALQAKNANAALAAADIIRQRFPQEFRACFDIAASLFHLPAPTHAEAVFGDLVRRFPHDPWAMHYYARLAGIRKDWSEAIRRWGLMKTQFPDVPAGYEGEGLALRDAGELDRAETVLATTAARFPGNFGIRFAHADVATRRCVWSTATARWESLVTDFPGTPAAYVGLAKALHSFGHDGEAERRALQAVQRFPNDYHAAYHYAWLAVRQQNWSDALQRWDRMRSDFPDDPIAPFEFAQAALALEQIDLAVDALAKAASRFPEHRPVQELHAIVGSLRPLPATGDMVARNEAKPIRAVKRRLIICEPIHAFREGEGDTKLLGGPEELGGNDYIEVQDATLYNLPGCYGMVELRDGRMYSVGQWGTFDTRVDTIARKWGEKCYKVANHPLLLRHRPQQLTGRFCMAYRLSSQLYFDFLTETLETVHESLSMWPDVPVLLPGCDDFFSRMPRSVFRDSVASVADGQDGQVLWLDEGIFQIDRLILRRKWWYGSFDFVRQIHRRVPELTARQADVIYISRTKANSRAIAREDEVTAAVRKVLSQCEIVHLEDQPFAGQVAIFRRAKVIIGAHGSGLANIVFCRPGTQIVEVLPENSPKMYAHISYMLSLDYRAYVIPRPVHHDREFPVDIAEFTNFLATHVAPCRKAQGKVPYQSETARRCGQLLGRYPTPSFGVEEKPMYVMTHHHGLLAADLLPGALRHIHQFAPSDDTSILVEISESDVGRFRAARGTDKDQRVVIENGLLAGCELVSSADPNSFSLRKQGLFACADPRTPSVRFDRKVASIWETFQFVPREEGIKILTHTQGDEAFAEQILARVSNCQPVCLHFGCGLRRIDGFINVDKFRRLGYSDDYFVFDFTERAWPIPDACVDYIYSEDFIEHLPQKNQLAFLAECFRVLKVGGFNRVNTPCLQTSMRVHSDFSRGFAGVYLAEYDRWNHMSLFTQTSLQELAQIVGYRRVYFTAKDRGTSVHAVPDTRPSSDRDQMVGNIFADLLR
jgi:tetratricopeptide (TPR) repeat protein